MKWKVHQLSQNRSVFLKTIMIIQMIQVNSQVKIEGNHEIHSGKSLAIQAEHQGIYINTHSMVLEM